MLLAYMGALWVLGRRLMVAKSWPLSSITSFNRLTLSRVLWVLSLAYSPVVGVTLEMFSCIRVGEVWVLYDQPSIQCGVGGQQAYRYLSVFWITVYVIGTPVLFAALLVYYNVPSVARELKRDALLRALSEHCARSFALAPPDGNDGLLSLTCTSISDAYLDALFVRLFPESADKAAAAAEAPRERKLGQLLAFSRDQLARGPVSWGVVEDPRMAGAGEAVGLLYDCFFADYWYWSFVELFFSLTISGVLGLVAPGTQGQVVLGLMLTYLASITYLRAQPYAEATYRLIGNSNAVTLNLFYLLGLLVKAQVTITDNNVLFLQVVNGVLITAMFLSPALIILRRLRWPLEPPAGGPPEAEEDFGDRFEEDLAPSALGEGSDGLHERLLPMEVALSDTVSL